LGAAAFLGDFFLGVDAFFLGADFFLGVDVFFLGVAFFLAGDFFLGADCDRYGMRGGGEEQSATRSRRDGLRW